MAAAPQGQILLTLTSNAERPRIRWLLGSLKAVLFAAAYLTGYVCSRYFAERTGTRLWFPDSILLCSLLLVPRKQWWICILLTAPARFVPGLRAPAPAWFLWANWINDVCKALLAAYLLQSDPVLFKRVRQYALYLAVAVILAPLFSAFFGALVRLTLGHAFWPSFGQWYLGDALANLVITPTLLLWFSREWSRLRTRVWETAVWVISFALCLCIIHESRWFNDSLITLCLPFPFLIWAAARLGPIGAATGLSITTVFVISGLSHAEGLFYAIAHDQHFLQLFLAVLALPILFVATLFEERQGVECRLRKNQEELNRNYQRTRRLATGLIQAQEDERKKIGRELHDDICQRIAILTIGLDRLAETTGNAEEDRSSLMELRSDAEKLGQSVRAVAHQLHSSNLQILGLVSALRGLCETFSRQYHVEVKLQSQLVSSLPDDVNLCLFRIVQESLNNAVHHGRARQIGITLSQTGELLLLRIEDAGIGFDPANTAGGLGFLSMEERLRLVGGALSIQSSPGQGTVIEAMVGFAQERPL